MKIEAIQADITRFADNEKLVKAAVDRFGTLNVAVNNAGILGQLLPLHQQSIEVSVANFSSSLFLCDFVVGVDFDV